MFKIITESIEWDEHIRFCQSNVFWTYDYYQSYQNHGTPEAVYYEDSRGRVFYPYLRRIIHSDQLSSQHYDITSAYGYGGPLIQCKVKSDEASLFNDFRKMFVQYCQESNIVSEFVRMHPLLVDSSLMSEHMDVSQVNYNVYVELHPERSEENDLSTYKKANRNSIRKAMKHGVEVLIDEDKGHLDEFIDIYNHTMKRNNAVEFYYFRKDYFKDLVERLCDNSVLVHAIYQNKIVSSELILFDESYYYPFLSGTLSDYYHLSANNLLTHKVVQWAKERRGRYYLLGGGYKPNDGIYTYKKSFAPKHEVAYYVGKKVINPDIYDLLSIPPEGVRYDDVDVNYFPRYRAWSQHTDTGTSELVDLVQQQSCNS